MSEFQKLKPLVLWLRAIESAHAWRSVIKMLYQQFDATEVSGRGPIVVEIRKYESMLGACMLFVLGPNKLENMEWWDDDI